MDDILLIDKPKSITSFDVIRVLRKTLNASRRVNNLHTSSECRVKMGHAGTLDPLATGLMIIGVGEGTKKLTEYIGLPKTYEAEVLLGKQTTTGDLEGDIIKEKVVETIDTQSIETIIKEMVGVHTLPVPIYSAIKRGGEALYKKARRGERVTPPKKAMEIYEIQLNDHYKEGDTYVLKITLHVSSGSYIRSLAEEIGRRLGYPATLQNLRRTKIGPFSLDDARTLEE